MTWANKVAVLVAGLFALTSTSCNNSGGTGGPLLKTIPAQSVGGGATFSLDLKSFVTDDSQTASYSVLSGGGSFSGSTYSRAFPTLGTYTVSFQVQDFRGNTARGTFDVKVTSANLALVRNGDGLSLLDMQTQNYVSPVQNDGRAKSYKGALANGSIILEVTQSAQTDLWLHDPNVAGTTIFGGNSSESETFVAKTSKNLIVYARGSAPSRTLWVYNPVNNSSTAISAVSIGGGPRDEYGAFVSGTRVYFTSKLTSSGQGDIYFWNLDTGTPGAISTNAADETIVATMPNGGVIWTRNGSSSEKDLLYWNGTAVTEIGADLSSAVNLESKTYKASTSDNRVVFETTTSGDEDLYIWNSATSTSAAIATSGVDETYVATSGSGRIVYAIQTGGSNKDLAWFKPSDATSGSIANTANDETYNGTLSNGDVIFTASATGLDLYHWVEATTTGTAFPNATSSGTDFVFAKVLGNDDVVYTVGTDLNIYTPSSQTSAAVTTSTGTETFAGVGQDAGDVVIQLVNGGVTSLYFWDKSATTATAISTTGVSSYQGVGSNGTVVFSRTAPSESQSDLWTFVPSGATTKQITNGTTTNDTVDAVISATN